MGNTCICTLQIRRGKKKLYKGKLSLGGDWLASEQPLRATVVFKDSTRLAQLHSSALDPARDTDMLLPELPFEVCVLRVRTTGWRAAMRPGMSSPCDA